MLRLDLPSGGLGPASADCEVRLIDPERVGAARASLLDDAAYVSSISRRPGTPSRFGR